MSYSVERLSHRDLLRLISFDWMICSCQLEQVVGYFFATKLFFWSSRNCPQTCSVWKIFLSLKELPSDMLSLKFFSKFQGTALRHAQFLSLKELPSDMLILKIIWAEKLFTIMPSKINRNVSQPTNIHIAHDIKLNCPETWKYMYNMKWSYIYLHINRYICCTNKLKHKLL